MSNAVETVCTITGQIRRRRRLCKSLFFIDIQPSNADEANSQIFFRTDDGTMDEFTWQDAFRDCRPGQVIEVQVGETLDSAEQKDRPFKVWQSCQPVKVIVPYTSREPFLQDPPLGKESKIKADKVCKYWINKNKCKEGDKCLFQHPTGDDFDQIRKDWVEERVKNRKLATHNPDDPHTSKKPHGLRAIIFADWIRKTFAKELAQGGGVLDIAGGKGEVSLVLSRGFGITSTVVEPKKRKLPNYWYTRLRRLMYRFETGSLEQPDWKSKEIQVDLLTWPSEVQPTYMDTLLDDQFLLDHADLVANTSLFVGLHSDEATIPIVDAALKAKKAFAVVPCCVFSHDNRTRTLKSGALVTTTEQQIQYICEKDTPDGSEIRTAYLDFEGKNVVVYWVPKEENKL